MSVLMFRALTTLLVVLATLTTALAREPLDWVPYVNDRFGFSLRYPADVFAPERKSEAGDGEVFVAIRGQGRLLVGAFENRERHNVASYMNLIRTQSYSDYEVSYAPRGQTWFVLSGESNDKVFYEKVMFSCQGRVINSFALVYPVQSKRLFDPIVEVIENTFRPGPGCGGHATR
jgi:hypothetical protein